MIGLLVYDRRFLGFELNCNTVLVSKLVTKRCTRFARRGGGSVMELPSTTEDTKPCRLSVRAGKKQTLVEASEEMPMMPPCVSGWNQFPNRLATH